VFLNYTGFEYLKFIKIFYDYTTQRQGKGDRKVKIIIKSETSSVQIEKEGICGVLTFVTGWFNLGHIGFAGEFSS
jgi:hypothetical protein